MLSIYKTIILLICSNAFMTFAWYGHLKNLGNKALWIAILASWSIAFFEYVFQVPANRIGFSSGVLSLAQLKILQEVITLSIFVPFAILYMRQPISWNFLWAGLCLAGAVYFIFR
ncbi:MAG: DMT family protein [Gammaproteobacteria bacterium]|nr:DMT family protein [Gammaproteobacteria bacterium]MCW5583198.1 DMT family protein [Gammaproteobacteria bacterium]